MVIFRRLRRKGGDVLLGIEHLDLAVPLTMSPAVTGPSPLASMARFCGLGSEA
jgi:hypothetical protein